MITNLLLDILNFIWYGGLEIFFPTTLPGGYTATAFGNTLNTISNGIGPVFRFINNFFPLTTLLIIFGLYIVVHLLIFMFQATKQVISIFRPGIR